MKITNIEFFILRCNTPKDYPKPLASFVNEGSIFIRVHTDLGITGLGEPSPYGSSLEKMVKALKNVFIPNFLGRNPLDIEKIVFPTEKGHGYGNVAYSAIKAGLTQAFWDIRGKYNQKPVYKLINPNSNGKIISYASAGMWYEHAPLEEVVNEALECLNDGFNFFKLRPETQINAGNHLQRNLRPPKVNLKRFIQLIEKINLETKGNLKIMVDVGCRLDFQEALYLIDAMIEQNCFFIEEPISRDFFEYAKLKKKSKISLAGGESLVSKSEFVPWVLNNSLDYLQPDANLAGINEIIKIDKLAKNHKLKIILHNWTNEINSAANIHLGAALNNCIMVETNLTHNPLKKNLLEEGIDPYKGEFTLSDKPGLGIKINESILKKFSYKINWNS